MAKYHFTVSVRVDFLPEQSNSDRQEFVFAYYLIVKNTGEVAAQLISRYWMIMDESGYEQEVKGLGVVGRQPFLLPNDQFAYSSQVMIRSTQGVMSGSYFCVAEDGERFEVSIAPFALCVPRILH